MLRSHNFLLGLLVALALCSAHCAPQQLSDCIVGDGCQIGPITLSNPATSEYQWNLPSDFVGGVYVILRSISGNADIFQLSPPNGGFFSSTFNSGEDRVYVPILPSNTIEGRWNLVVTTVTRTSSFYLTVRAVRDIPKLSAKDTQALNLFKEECCKDVDSNACRRIVSTSDICRSPYMYCDPDTGALLTLNLAGGATSSSTSSSFGVPFSCREAPSSLGMFSALETLDLSYLRGVEWTLDGIATVVAPSKIKRLYLSGNRISGELPCELFTGTGNGTSLETLWLQDNIGVRGSIPDCAFSANLIDLSLARNSITGAIPDTIPTNSKLQMLQVDAQALAGEPTLSGTIPSSIKNARDLFFLSLGFNNISGTIPEMPESLESLWLLYNQLEGTIPSHLLDLPELLTVWLAGNKLSGSIDPRWGSKKGLQQLFISSNALTGSIDFDWSGNPDLIVLRASINQLTGAVPASLGKLPNLSMLRLQSNALTAIDDFAAALESSNSITVFNISSNQFTGPLPDGLSNLGVFSKPSFNEVNTGAIIKWNRTFDISNNSFEGTFPGWMLQKLDALATQSFFTPVGFELRMMAANGTENNRFFCPDKGNALSSSATEKTLNTLSNAFGLTCTVGTAKTREEVPLSDKRSAIVSSSAPSKSSSGGKLKWWGILLVVLTVLVALVCLGALVMYVMRVMRRRKAVSFTEYQPGHAPHHGVIQDKLGSGVVEMKADNANVV